MPPEPKRPIEELLEASAKARRAEFGADPPMPNPMRARLHDEIARMNRIEEAQPRRSWLAKFWPQVSIATAVAAVLVTAAVLQLRPRTPRGNRPMAMNASVRPENAGAPVDALRSLDASPQMAAAATSTVSSSSLDRTGVDGRLADNGRALKSSGLETDDKSNGIRKFAEVTVAPSEPIIAPAAALEAAGKDKDARVASRSDAPARDAPAVMSAPAQSFASKARAPELAENSKTENAKTQQQFSQTARGQALRSNQNARPAVNILDNFQVEQNGREIRVVDADGSTYTGKLEPVTQSAPRRMFKQKEAAPAAAATGAISAETKSAPTQNELFFRATGFNSSLKKRVVFEGNYIPLPAPGKKSDAREKSDDAEQMPARIVGTAKVPGESPIEIDAATVAR